MIDATIAETLLSVGCFLLLFFFILVVMRLKQVLKNYDKLYSKNIELGERARIVESQRKSSEVRTAMMVEKMLPFTKDFPFNPRESQFLGQPIDYMVFGEEKVTFVEVKSGNARLNDKQKRIKKLIQDKKVVWKEIRIK